MFTDFLKKVGDSLPNPEPKIPNGKVVQLIAEEEDEINVEKDVADTIGAALFITYKNSKGDISSRRISIKKTDGNKIWAYCFERRALRSFRLDRIIEAIDMSTGEVLLETEKLLSDFSTLNDDNLDNPISATKRSLQKCKHGLNILVYLARCDGHFHSDEVDILSHYMMSECFDTNFDSDYLLSRFQKHYPDVDDFFNSIESLEKSDPKSIQLIARYAAQIVQADGIIVKEEIGLLTELQEAVRVFLK